MLPLLMQKEALVWYIAARSGIDRPVTAKNPITTQRHCFRQTRKFIYAF